MTSLRVLIVDDDPMVLVSMSRVFGAGHPEVMAAIRSPLMAISDLERTGQRFDIVLADLQMGEMAGDELLARVRELLPDARRVIVTSALRTVDDFAEGLVHDVLLKPFTQEELRAVLAKAQP